MRMTIKLKRPEKKSVETKVSEEDMIYFSLGIDRDEFILPSQRKDYRSDARALQLLEDIRNGKKISNSDFSGVNLKGADISGGLFQDCNFSGAVFYKTKAQTCDFTNCCFDEAYMEGSDFMGCDFTGASFKRVFSKNNNWEKAFLDEEDAKFLSALEQIIQLIERGKIDIHCLSKNDLLGLDIRRLDFSKVDLEGLDLSVFALDGINLCGTYIDPKQLMSLEGWNSYCLDLRRTKEITRARLERKIILDKEDDLRQYVDNQKMTTEPIKTKTVKRPIKKRQETEEQRAWGIEKARQEFVKKHVRENTDKEKMEPAERYLFEKYLKQYPHLDPQNKRQKETEINVRTSPEMGIPVTVQNIQAMQADVVAEPKESTFIAGMKPTEMPTTVYTAETKDTLIVNTQSLSDIATEHPVENSQIDLNKNDSSLDKNEQATPPKIEPKLIVSHEQVESENLKRSQVEYEETIKTTREVQQTQQTIEIVPEQPREKQSKYVVQTPYPYFNELPETQEETDEEILKKSEADDEEETIHDLTSAGLSLDEITELLRQKGPLKVTGKAPKGRASRHKTKG